MKKILGIALLAGGVVLLVNGYEAYNSLESRLGKALRGSPSRPAVFLLTGGAACAVAGGALILLSKSK
jgi:drug/metabolite transporter (DMT)-like permease